MTVTLELERLEEVWDDTILYQAENGTVYYREDKKLWVHFDEQKVEVEMMGGFKYSISAVQENCIYYGSNWKKKVYQAEFNSSGAFEIKYIRDLNEDEVIHQGGFCSTMMSDGMHVHRICDDPNIDTLLVDAKREDLDRLEFKVKHGKVAIFRKTHPHMIAPTVKRLGSNVLLLVCYRGLPRRFLEVFDRYQDMWEQHSPWGSAGVVKGAYAYITNGASLFVIDPEKATILPPLNFAGVDSFYIAGIHEGVLTGRGRCQKSGKYYKMTAKLPDEYMMQPIQPIPPAPVNRFLSRFFRDFIVQNARGVGGFGRVFEVTNKIDKSVYALKRVAVDKKELEQSLSEVRKMAILDHPGIVQYKTSWVEEPPSGWQNRLDRKIGEKVKVEMESYFDDDQVFIYIQMKLYKSSLEEWLNDNRTASSRARPLIKTWFKQVVTAVAYLHENNIIHGDLKPANILMDESDRLKLCDLGISTERKIVTEENGSEMEVTTSRNPIGTSLYMSPEHLSILAVYSSRTDIFMLGLILAEMSVVLSTIEEKARVFDSYRCGEIPNLLDDEELTNFVAWIATPISKNRPTCSQILEHPFIQSD